MEFTVRHTPAVSLSLLRASYRVVANVNAIKERDILDEWIKDKPVNKYCTKVDRAESERKRDNNTIWFVAGMREQKTRDK